jgi:multicomponent Na+:H+ antiporter subunit C
MTTNLTLVVIVGVLVACGVYLLLERSIIKMLLGLLLIGNGINLLIIALSGPAGDAPVVGSDNVVQEDMADPLAQAMVLTSIVITMGIAAFVLALTYRSYSIRARDEVENDPEDTMVSQRRTLADAPGRDRSDDPVTGEPSKSGDAFDAEGNPIPLEALTNIEDLEVYEDLHDGDFDDPTDSAYDDPRNPGSGNPHPTRAPIAPRDEGGTGDGTTGATEHPDDHGKTDDNGEEGNR